jgi:hypothetical protein
MCPPSDCSRFGRLIAPGQLILERDVLEVFAGVSDPVLRRLAVQRWHEPYNGVRAADRAEYTVHANVRSMIHRLGSTSNPAASDRLTICNLA